jgi:hypothetical protein
MKQTSSRHPVSFPLLEEIASVHLSVPICNPFIVPRDSCLGWLAGSQSRLKIVQNSGDLLLLLF